MMEEFIIKRSVFYRELEEKYEKLKKEYEYVLIDFWNVLIVFLVVIF
jgi:hypothetical protein